MAENKRQEPEEDHWDVVEGPAHFTFDPPKDRAKVLAKAKPKPRAPPDVVPRAKRTAGNIARHEQRGEKKVEASP